ncbi:type VI secretion protein IcmF/TssM N-terminal domain-containing protein [Desulfatitalea alkaliphila]|uniref:Type VI secretion system component TssM1 N-terminal domain-containing protein n=1 Tax=Desulfatitalea alkaliphila TaxID=2929485 RepID=A0AA41URK3_9BACT|nr:type VI secretion protein IcmF/TssM N-terminal domain-containing protein [Desulfatitalea alkaliphila]MCJ8502438.1 hypothetical protein [Desulfatitalea alkaliphila]
MARLLMTALKISLLLLLALAVGFGALLLADHQGWPRWTVAVALVGLLFLVVLVLLLRRYYYRRREAKFVRRVVTQDQQAIDAAPLHERRRLVALQERWATAVATLRASQLRHRGDPLYRLPWFMIFGESGSGKSTAVAHARLKNILTDAGPTGGIAGTQNCDWWFFEKAVVLDAAGRYAVPVADEDRGEWERFLVLLAKYRRKEPLNGLIVTLPADRLLAGDLDALADYGRSLRLRIDQLMRVLGAKFPVYLLLTKIDLVPGLTAMAELLPDERRSQALGLLSAAEQGDPRVFVDAAIADVSRRLKALRLRLAAPVGKAAGRAVLFPDEFERLAPAIRAFVDGAFHENPYQETPFLRGFFISSGRQSGLVRSGVLGGLESFKERQWQLPDTGRGLFLRDFFDAILPRDRSGFRLLGEYRSWRQATANLALTAWLLLLLTAIGLAGFSYMHIRQVMAPVHADFNRPPELGGDLARDLVTLGLLRDRIVEMEQRLHHRIRLDMGFNQGRQALRGLKRAYNQWFRTHVLDPTDAAMRDRIITLGSHARDDTALAYLEYLVWRVNALASPRAGSSDAPGPAQAGSLQALALVLGEHLPYVTAYFPDMYRSYAMWEADAGRLERERLEMQAWANRIIELEGRDLHWLVDWADSRITLMPITLDDFWPGPGRVAHVPRVSGAFTVQGKGEIERLVAQLGRVATDRAVFDKRVRTFWDAYARQFEAQWSAFARGFGQGRDKLLTRDGWLGTGAAMATLDNPYFRLIARMDEEFDAIRALRPQDHLARLAREYTYIANSYQAAQAKATLKTTIAAKVQRLEAHLDRLDKSLAASDEFSEYMKALDGFVTVNATPNTAYRFALDHYGQSAGDGTDSPVVQALAAAKQIRSLLGHDPAVEAPFWALLEGPLDFLVDLATFEAACTVNDLWQSQVVARTARMPENALWPALFGEQGLVEAFVAASAQPFLRRTRNGWRPEAWLGRAFPFQQPFLAFLDQGALRRQQLQPSYTVSLAGRPTNVNPEARSEPYQTRLTLQCAGGLQTLDNFNAPSALDFVWEPATCDHVTLTIFFEAFTLTHAWRGQWGFRDFLRAFRDGREVFTPADFPQQKGALDNLGVRFVQVNYTIRNAEPVLVLETYPALQVPDKAAHCWPGPTAGPGPDPQTGRATVTQGSPGTSAIGKKGVAP